MLTLNRPNKNLFLKQENNSLGIIGLLRIIGISVEIIASLLAAIFTAGATIPLTIAVLGSSFQIGLDIYQYVNNQISTKDFVLSSLINIFSLAIPYAIKPVINRLRTGSVAIRGTSNTKYIIRGAENFKDALKNATINPNKYTRLSIYETRKLFRTSNIPAKFIISGNKYQNEFNKYFGNYYKFSNKDRAILNNVVKNVNKNKVLNIPWNRLSENAKNTIVNNSLKNKTIKGVLTASKQEFNTIFEALRPYVGYNLPPIEFLKSINYVEITKSLNNQFFNLATLYNQQISKGIIKRILLWFGTRGANKLTNVRNIQSYGGYRVTQMLQRLDPTNLARDVVKGIYYKFNQFLKKAGQNVSKLAISKNIGEKVLAIDKIALENIAKRNRLFYEYWKKTSNWVKRKYVYIDNIIKKANGYKFKSTNYVMGFQVIENQPKHQILRVFFNPVTTNAKITTSKNFGGKKPVIIKLSKAQINAWKNDISPGRFYNKGSKLWPPIATSPGGKLIDWANKLFDGLGDLLTFIPIQGLRNLLSISSNLKNVTMRLLQGTFKEHFARSFVPAFLRNLTTQGAKFFARAIAVKTKLAPIGRRILEQLTIGSVKIFTFQSTKTITLQNGKKLKSSTFGFRTTANWKSFATNTVLGSIKSYSLNNLRRRINSKSHALTRKYNTSRKLQTYRRALKLPFK